MYSEEVCGWVGCCLNWELMGGGQGEVGSEGGGLPCNSRGRGRNSPFTPNPQWTDGTGISLETAATPVRKDGFISSRLLRNTGKQRHEPQDPKQEVHLNVS